jgi:hypothetical protein
MKRLFMLVAEFIALGMITLTGSLTLLLAAPAGHAFAANSDPVEHCKHSFLGLKPWYQYIGKEMDSSSCNVKCFNVFTTDEANDCGQTSSDVPLVLLAVVDDLLRVAALVALAFILMGSFKYVGSQGSPDGTKQAQDTIINALIGLALALTAVAIVSFIGNKLGG